MQDMMTIKEAYVVFSAQADLPWLKILKPGFRHCAVLINDGAHWLTIDPMSHYMDVTVHHVPVDFNLPLWMEDRGHKVVRAKVERPIKAAPWGVFTCVEAVKRVLGIHSRTIITPHQLYRHLKGEEAPSFLARFRQFIIFQGDLAWEV